ncbi:MAG: thioesterase family protein [Crocosphaera sp.]|nr:thioesterase family protein [Crocosphaera sp.]
MTYYRTIHFSDTDAAGVVYFAALLSICHEAYENALQVAKIDLKTFFTSSDIAIPIVHAEIDFYQPLFCGDRIQINLTPIQLNETEFEINYQVFYENTLDKLIAKATTNHVSINPKIRKRSPLPLSIIKWLKPNQNNY